MIKVQTTLVAGPRNHRQLIPRGFSFGKLLFLVRAAKNQNFDQVAIKEGVQTLACAPRPQFHSAPILDSARTRGARVLLVEDNEINQEVAILQLEDAEVAVDVADNGEIAVRMVKEKAYDLVLGLAIHEFIRRQKNQKPTGKRPLGERIG